MFILRPHPDEMGESAVLRGISKPEAFGRPGHFGLGVLAGQEVGRAVAAAPRQQRRVRQLPVLFADAAGHAWLDIDAKLRRIEADPVLVAAAAESQQIVKALLEDAQPGHLCAFRHIFGDKLGSKTLGQALFAGDAAGGDGGDGREREVLVEVANRPGHGGNQAFGLASDVGHEGAPACEEDVHGLLVIFIIDPARFVPDAVDGFFVFFGVVVADVHHVVVRCCSLKWYADESGELILSLESASFSVYQCTILCLTRRIWQSG